MWNSKGVDLATSTDIWNDETGETVAEAYARFSTFGPVMGALDALAYLSRNPGVDMMSFGYGDDPEDFDSIDWTELAQSVNEDGVEATDNVWGPFAPWLNTAEHWNKGNGTCGHCGSDWDLTEDRCKADLD